MTKQCMHMWINEFKKKKFQLTIKKRKKG
jgi:hypothetical protein